MSFVNPAAVQEELTRLRMQDGELRAQLASAEARIADQVRAETKAELDAAREVGGDLLVKLGTLQAKYDADVGAYKGRVAKLRECLRWVRDRDKQWRGVAIELVNKRLDEEIGDG